MPPPDATDLTADETLRGTAAKKRIELMHVPEPADSSFVALVRSQLDDAHVAARMLVDDLTAT